MRRIIDALDRQSTWSKLRLLGNSHIAQATLVVPLLGYFLLFNENIFEYLRLHVNFCAKPACAVSWRLQLLYFGSFFIAIGAGIYGLRCPTVVKML
jgi:hypothetical protein